MVKQYIINSDGFGFSKSINKAVLNGYHNGFITGASLCANGNAFNGAVNEIIPECPNLSVGVNLNITKGSSLTKAPLLTNSKGKFNKNFLQILLSSKKQAFLNQIEFEFRTQIETILNYSKVDHIDSVDMVHIIPELFALTIKLAEEYNINYIRTVHEEIYFIPDIKKYINLKLPINILMLLLYSYYSNRAKNLLKTHNIKTNDFYIGNEFKGHIDNSAIVHGLSTLNDENNILVEISVQYKNLLNIKELKDKISRLGFEVTSHKKV